MTAAALASRDIRRARSLPDTAQDGLPMRAMSAAVQPRSRQQYRAASWRRAREAARENTNKRRSGARLYMGTGICQRHRCCFDSKRSGGRVDDHSQTLMQLRSANVLVVMILYGIERHRCRMRHSLG